MPEPAEPPSAEPAAELLRHVFGHFPTGVTVVTAIDEGEPVGMACNSFSSVSLDPPLVSFCVARTSETWPRIQAAGRFAINILRADQHHLGRTFSMKGVDRFADVGWTPSPLGNPLLDDALAWLDCAQELVHEAGDHELVLGRVGSLEGDGDGEPLVFYRGGFARLAPDR